MARKQERKNKSFNLEDSPVVEENERLLNNATTPQQTQTIVAPVAEATEQPEAAEPAEAVAPIVQPQQQVQPQPQVQPQVHPEPQPQPSQPMGMSIVGNRSKRTEQGITMIVPMEYYEQIALMKMPQVFPFATLRCKPLSSLWISIRMIKNRTTMKKTIVTLMLSLFCMIVQEQTHMKFMGIPLNGNVELFMQKLKAKGLTCDVAKTKASPSGVKIYKGLFMGEDSEFMIFFNPKDKNVFAVEVSPDYSSLELAKTLFANILKQLKEKYSKAVVDVLKDSDGNAEGFQFYVSDAEEKKMLGIIMQKLIRPDGILQRKYLISLFYGDVENFKKSENKNYDDL